MKLFRTVAATIATAAVLTACGTVKADTTPTTTSTHVTVLPAKSNGALFDWRGQCIGTSRARHAVEQPHCAGPQWLIINNKGGTFYLTSDGLYLGRGKNNVATMGSVKTAVKIDVVGYGPNDTCVLGFGVDNSSLTLRVQKNGSVVWSEGADKQSDFRMSSGLDCSLKA